MHHKITPITIPLCCTIRYSTVLALDLAKRSHQVSCTVTETVAYAIPYRAGRVGCSSRKVGGGYCMGRLQSLGAGLRGCGAFGKSTTSTSQSIDHSIEHPNCVLRPHGFDIAVSRLAN